MSFSQLFWRSMEWLFFWQEEFYFSQEISKTYEFLRQNIILGSIYPNSWNIPHMTQGVLCSSCDSKSISCEKKYSFIHRENPVVTDIITPFVTGCILPVTESFLVTWVCFSCDRNCSSYFKEYWVRHKRNIFCHWNDFSTCIFTRNIFMWDIIFSCDTSCTSC